MTSYLIVNEAENLQNGDVHLVQTPDFKYGISREPLGALRSVMARCFCIFHALSFELNFFFDWRFPLTFVSKSH